MDNQDYSIEERFYKWLSTQVSPEKISNYRAAFVSLDGFFVDKRIHNKHIFETTDNDTLLRLKQIADHDRVFRLSFITRQELMSDAIGLYISFINQTYSNQGPPSREDESLNRKDKPLVVKKETKTKPKPKRITDEARETKSSDDYRRQPNWTLYEAALLLEGCLDVVSNNTSKQRTIRDISHQLRTMAVNNGMEIDDKYRNITGITFQLESMISAYYGYTVMKPASKLFLRIVDIYNTDKALYRMILNKARADLTKNDSSIDLGENNHQKGNTQLVSSEVSQGIESNKTKMDNDPDIEKEQSGINLQEDGDDTNPIFGKDEKKPSLVEVEKGEVDKASLDSYFPLSEREEAAGQTEARDSSYRNDTNQVQETGYKDITRESVAPSAGKTSAFVQQNDLLHENNMRRSAEEDFNVFTNDEKSILRYHLSNRVKNALARIGIITIDQLLSLEEEELRSIKNLGKKSIDELLEFKKSIIRKNSCQGITSNNKEPTDRLSLLLKDHVDDLILGEYSFLEGLELSAAETVALEQYRQAASFLDIDLMVDCLYSREKIIPIMSAFSDYIYKVNRLSDIERIISDTPVCVQKRPCKLYIDAYSYNENTRNNLLSFYSYPDAEIRSIVQTIDYTNKANLIQARQFLQWCNYDLALEITEVFKKLYSANNAKTIMEGRANHLTLNELGEQLDLTRERVRQIESKVKRNYYSLQGKIHLIEKLYANNNGEAVVHLESLRKYAGENAAVFIYLLKSSPNRKYIYDDQIESLIIGDTSVVSRIQDYIDSLSDVVREGDVENIINTANSQYDLDTEIVKKAFNDVYKKTGSVYHRSRLSLSKVFLEVLRKYYPQGIHIYDDNEIESFRNHVLKDFGDISLSKNNHAIAARISSVCVLADRGTYIPKRDKWLSASLVQKLYTFIEQNDSPILLIGSVFNTFEEELIAEGITNRFFLQGILRELFGEKFYFKKDYVSRDKNFTSIYSAIVSFIKESKYPVDRADIKSQFVGITDIVITLATSDNEILNYFGSFFHLDNLSLRESEKDYLFECLSELLADQKVHHIKDIYPCIISNSPEILNRNFANSPFSAFSILEKLFNDVFQFSRPFISLKSVTIGSSSERLQGWLNEKDDVLLSELLEYAKENHFGIQSQIEFINSLNDRYLLKDKDSIATIREIGVNEKIANEVEACIYEEIKETTPLRALQCLYKLPPINYPWNEWLLYSVLKKWGSKLEVALSSSQLRQSIPLVSKRGAMDVSRFNDVKTMPVKIKIDDMADIDNLLADILTDELLEESE